MNLQVESPFGELAAGPRDSARDSNQRRALPAREHPRERVRGSAEDALSDLTTRNHVYVSIACTWST
jgi:hypothetical protein